MSYIKNVEKMKNLNLAEAGCFIEINIGDKKSKRKILNELDKKNKDYIEYGNGNIEVHIWDYDKLRDKYDEVNYINSYWSDYEEKAILKKVIKNYDYYLIYGNGITWDGLNGYKIVNGINEIVRRSYDVNIYPVKATRGGKYLECIESSHDVPMGCTIYIMGLTDKEYETVKNKDIDEIRNYIKNK